MKKIFLILSFILFFCVDGFSQSTQWDDQNKYWSYRYRLVNNFLIRGEENPIICDSRYSSGYSIPAGNSLTISLDLDWGDGTSYLGWYISVLATEFKLLNNNGQSTEATKRELYFAMKAYERLDRKAEKVFYPYNNSSDCSTGYVDGLFVRDDVSKKFLKRYPDFIAKYIKDDNELTINSDYHKFHQSDDHLPSEGLYENDGSDDSKNNIYPTQDQISDLFMGFALVKKCLGDNETYQGYNFTQHAIIYTKAIADRLEADDWVGKFANGDVYYNGNNIKDEFAAYGLAKAAQAITNIDYTSKLSAFTKFKWLALADPVLGPEIMKAIYNGTNVSFSFNGETHTLLSTEKKDYLTALLQTFAAVGHSWEYSIGAELTDAVYIKVPGFCDGWPCLKDKLIGGCYEIKASVPGILEIVLDNSKVCAFDPILFSSLPVPDPVVVNVTTNMLGYYGTEFHQEIYSLLHEYLHGSNNNISNSTYLNILQSAPCEGPQYKPRGDQNILGINGWRGVSRWERPQSADGTIDIDNYAEGIGRFNGLDYLLLYNLELLAKGTENISYKNSLNLVSDKNLISSGKYWSYETLELTGSVQSNTSTNNGTVEITASNTVSLKPGFKVESGANTKIYLGNYTACNTSAGNSSNLRTMADVLIEKDNANTQEAVIKNITDQIRNKINDMTASLNQANNELRTKKMEGEARSKQVSLFPNPSDGKFSLEFYLKSDQRVKITVSNSSGDQTITLYDDHLKSGINKLDFNINELNTGVFNIMIKGKEINQIRRLIKMKK